MKCKLHLGRFLKCNCNSSNLELELLFSNIFKVYYLFSSYPHEAGVKYKIHFVLINGEVDLPGGKNDGSSGMKLSILRPMLESFSGSSRMAMTREGIVSSLHFTNYISAEEILGKT